MKKTINKICSAALVLATSATAVGAVLVSQPDETKNVQVYAEPQVAATETYLAIKGGEATAKIGSSFDIPTAQLFVKGESTPVELTLADVKVYTPISNEKELAASKSQHHKQILVHLKWTCLVNTELSTQPHKAV